jgi:hypothetical protein
MHDVIPAKAGIHLRPAAFYREKMDACLRRHDAAEGELDLTG